MAPLFDADKVRFAIMPTCWVNDDFPWVGDAPYRQIMSEMALAGFQGCSISHTYPSDPEVLKYEMGLRGLQVSEPWVSLYFTSKEMRDLTLESFRRELDKVVAMGGSEMVVAELGNSVHQLPDVALLPNRPIFDDDQWERLADGLNEVGRMTADAGLLLCYHHHMGTGVQTRADVDRLMSMTDPQTVHLLLDAGHLAWSGDDPVALARDYVHRIRHVHLKDIRQVRRDAAVAARSSFYQGVMDGVFTVPGDGDLDFVAIFTILAEAGYEGWFSVEAEQDPAVANPLEYALKARAYIRDVVGL